MKGKIKDNKNGILKRLSCFILAILLALGISGCTSVSDETPDGSSAAGISAEEAGSVSEHSQAEASDSSASEIVEDAATVEEVSEYSGQSFVTVNGNTPFFSEDEITTEEFEVYSELDELGRCGTAYANISRSVMPTEEREGIGMIRPSGWHTVKYEGVVEGNYLYNRCHLIGYQLAGENANTLNLITGTRWFNVEGMLPFENAVANYVKDTGNHVLYRVTPVYEGDSLVASGVEIEALSVEDNSICFNVYIYNVQPGVEIDYHTGESSLSAEYEKEIETANETQQLLQSEIETVVDGTAASVDIADPTGGAANTGSANTGKSNASEGGGEYTDSAEEKTYILNTNTKKFHLPDCSSVGDIKSGNKQEYTGTRSELITDGYSPCGNCKP